MANLFNAVYAPINAAAKMTKGLENISVVDVNGLVSLGQKLDSDMNLAGELYTNLVKQIIDVRFAIRKYEGENRGIAKDESEWGYYLEKISFESEGVTASGAPTYQTDALSPYDIAMKSKLVARYFGDIGTWTFEERIPAAKKMRDCLRSEEGYVRFVDALRTKVDNEYQLALENLENLTEATLIAGVATNGKTAQIRNVITEYNTKFQLTGDAAVTADNYTTKPDFYSYVMTEMALAKKSMAKISTKFHTQTSDGKEIDRHTPADKLKVEVNTRFVEEFKNYVRPYQYEPLTGLDGFTEVLYWQSPDQPLKVMVKHDDFKTEQNTTGAVTVEKVFAVMRDEDSCFCSIHDVYRWEKFNERTRDVTFGIEGAKGYGVDTTENAIIWKLA